MYYRIKVINTNTGDVGISTTVYHSHKAAKSAAVRLFSHIPGFEYVIIKIS